MIDATKPNVSSAVENLADAVTHARYRLNPYPPALTYRRRNPIHHDTNFLCVIDRFVGSDPGSDEVVLMKILEVLKLLILSRVGLLLTNESICEIMQSTLR